MCASSVKMKEVKYFRNIIPNLFKHFSACLKANKILKSTF